MSTAPYTFLAQITDPHIREPGRLAYGRIDTTPYLGRAIDSLLALPQRPDALVLTGDLCDFGREAEYAHLAELLAPLADLPVYLLPGNHDERVQLRKSFAHHAYLQGDGKFVQYSVRVGPLRLTGSRLAKPSHVKAASFVVNPCLRNCWRRPVSGSTPPYTTAPHRNPASVLYL